MDHGRAVKKIFESKLERRRRRRRRRRTTTTTTTTRKTRRRRRRGRPRLRWLKDVEKNLREMKVKGWRHKAVDREKWASVIKEAKDLRGLYCRAVSKEVCLTWNSIIYPRI
jgi:hypothetical protein